MVWWIGLEAYSKFRDGAGRASILREGVVACSSLGLPALGLDTVHAHLYSSTPGLDSRI